MPARDNEVLIRGTHAAYNYQDLDRVLSYDADDHEWVIVAAGETFRGAEGSKRYLRTWADAFPDDFVVVEYTSRSAHEGTLRSFAGDIPSTGRPVEMRFCDAHHVEDGKISRSRSYFDLPAC